MNLSKIAFSKIKILWTFMKPKARLTLKKSAERLAVSMAIWIAVAYFLIGRIEDKLKEEIFRYIHTSDYQIYLVVGLVVLILSNIQGARNDVNLVKDRLNHVKSFRLGCVPHIGTVLYLFIYVVFILSYQNNIYVFF